MRLVIAAALSLVVGTPLAAAARRVDRILIDKSDRTLTMLAGQRAIAVYRDIKMGDAPEGPKHFEGDERTPEGRYTINKRNSSSHYHLSLRISYPNATDRAYAATFNRSAGGDIFIHGQPNGYPMARIPTDWTNGCIALSNAEMDELWKQVKIGTRVTIRP
jgi:murein L,D-transpeptidase YafK